MLIYICSVQKGYIKQPLFKTNLNNKNTAFSTLNYEKLMALKPTIYDTIVNQLGQKIELVEHPIKGDEFPVIAIYHEEKIAVNTEFWDCGDFYENSEYNPVYMHGVLDCAFNFDL